MDALEGFASGGLRAGDSVIIIAAREHRRALERRLRERGFDLDLAGREERFIPVDAAGLLAEFMPDGRLDAARFKALTANLLARAQGRRVRAFGEMVALLWGEGRPAAALELERLWNQLRDEHAFCLFCAYPRSCFGAEAEAAMVEVCGQHSRVIPG
jgi:hypothetical protein